MVRIALAPCSPFSVTEQLMVRSAELAERLDVRLHTHFAENAEDDEFSLATVRLPADGVPRAHRLVHRPDVGGALRDAERRRGAPPRRGRHRRRPLPEQQLILSSGIAPVVRLRAAGVTVGLGVDGSSSADSASLWLEARQAMLLAKLRDGAAAGTARMALEMRHARRRRRASAATGELGVLAPGAVGDLAVWRLDGPAFAGALADPVEAWLRCGPVSAWHTIVNGRFVVRDGDLVHPDLDEMLRRHTPPRSTIQRLSDASARGGRCIGAMTPRTSRPIGQMSAAYGGSSRRHVALSRAGSASTRDCSASCWRSSRRQRWRADSSAVRRCRTGHRVTRRRPVDGASAADARRGPSANVRPMRGRLASPEACVRPSL